MRNHVSASTVASRLAFWRCLAVRVQLRPSTSQGRRLGMFGTIAVLLSFVLANCKADEASGTAGSNGNTTPSAPTSAECPKCDCPKSDAPVEAKAGRTQAEFETATAKKDLEAVKAEFEKSKTKLTEMTAQIDECRTLKQKIDDAEMKVALTALVKSELKEKGVYWFIRSGCNIGEHLKRWGGYQQDPIKVKEHKDIFSASGLYSPGFGDPGRWTFTLRITSMTIRAGDNEEFPNIGVVKYDCTQDFDKKYRTRAFYQGKQNVNGSSTYKWSARAKVWRPQSGNQPL